MIILVFRKGEDILRVGLYEKTSMRWVKWLPKKKYKIYAQSYNIEIRDIIE